MFDVHVLKGNLKMPKGRSVVREVDLNSLMAKIDSEMAPEFFEFVRLYSGAEGLVSPDNYVQIWNIEDMLNLNPYYPENPASHSLFFFAGDGSNLGYAFDKTTRTFVAIDFLDIGELQAINLGATIEEFIQRIS